MSQFLDGIGKRLSDAGQGVAKHTKNFTEVTRLNGAIAEQERQAAALLRELGRPAMTGTRTTRTMNMPLKLKESGPPMPRLPSIRPRSVRSRASASARSAGQRWDRILPSAAAAVPRWSRLPPKADGYVPSAAAR